MSGGRVLTRMVDGLPWLPPDVEPIGGHSYRPPVIPRAQVRLPPMQQLRIQRRRSDAKLNDFQVLLIRALWESGFVSMSWLGRHFRVSTVAIWKAVHR